MSSGLLSRRAITWLAAALAAVAMSGASAQEALADPPERVARLSLTDGEVSVAPAGTEEWADAVLNRPLTGGDRIWTGGDGRAELQVGSASVHLDRSTGFEFLELDADVMQMSLTEGAMSIRVRALGERETVQIETPHATVHLRRPGEYTLQIDPDSDRTIVRTRGGEAEVVGASKSFRVRADEEGVFTGLDGLTARIGPLPRRNAFEAWANDRDRRSERSLSARYVSREVIGYEDLDDHGEWVHEPEYGHVWRPIHVVHDWAPYRYGRWAWVRPWGWTWIDDTRWGFAPFHYGRWAYLRRRWCWVPGPRHVRPVYAPALVGWVGNPSLNVSVSFGSGVGWFPLAPHEVYVPWHRHTPRYIRHVNVSNTIIVNHTHITNIYNGRDRPRHYRNRGLAEAITVVQRDMFVAGRPVGRHRMHVDERELRQWRDDVRPSRIAPERHSILAGEPRRAPATRVAFSNDHPKRQGDFRTARQRSSAGDIKRGTVVEHGRPAGERAGIREQARGGQPLDRPQITRRDRPTQDAAHGDQRQRPSERVLQANPPGGPREHVRENVERSRPSRTALQSTTPSRTPEESRARLERSRTRTEQHFQRPPERQEERAMREPPRMHEYRPAPQPHHAAPAERQPRAEARVRMERAPDARVERHSGSASRPSQGDRPAQRTNQRHPHQ